MYYCYRECDIAGERSPSLPPQQQQPDHPAVADRDINHYTRGSGPAHVHARASAGPSARAAQNTPHGTRPRLLEASHDNPDVIISNGPVHV